MEHLSHQISCSVKARRYSSEKNQKLPGSIGCIHRIYYFSRSFATLHIVFPLKTLKQSICQFFLNVFPTALHGID